jgi:hypothetical protein
MAGEEARHASEEARGVAEELRHLAEAGRHAAEEQNLILQELRETVRRYEGLFPMGELRDR